MGNTLLVNSKDKSKFYIVDLESNKCFITSRQDCKIDKYSGDSVKISESIGTVAFINKEFNVIGILRERRSGVGIAWIRQEDAEIDAKYTSLSNLHGNLVDITSVGIDIFNPEWFNRLEKSILVKNLQYKLVNKQTFLESIGIAPKEDIQYDGESDAIEEELNSDCKSNNTNNLSMNTDANFIEVFNSYMSNIENRLLEVAKREEAVAQKEAELTEKSNKLNRIFAEYDGVDLSKLNEVVLDVDLIVSNGSIEEKAIEKPDYLYELMLKTLSINDCITIPKSYYSKLKIYTKKQLEMNVSYTKYKMLSTIKLRATDKENLVAMIEYDEDATGVKIVILKEFGNNTFEQDEVRNYLSQYTVWKKQTFNT